MTEPLTREQFAHLVSTYISEETWLERGKQIIAHDAALRAESDALKEQVADVVPQSRYDACNRDWLEAKAKLKQVQGSAFTEIADLTRKLAERTVKAENILLHVLARPDLGEAYPTFCKLWRAECEQHARELES